MSVVAAMEQARAILRERWGHDDFKKAQVPVVEAALSGRDVLAVLPTGYGKCHAAGDRVLLHGGGTKAIEDVRVGDVLTAPDGTPQPVLEIGTGYDRMVRITPKRGDSLTVTEDHVLVLAETGKGEEGWVEVEARDYLAWSKNRKHLYKLVRVAVEYPERNVSVPPYVMGALIGDGTLSQKYSVGFTSVDAEVEEEVTDFAVSIGCGVRRDKITTRYHKGHTDPTEPNPLLERLRPLGLVGIACEDRFIPAEYLYASRAQRLELLAGLIDTDGYMNGPATFGYTSKSKTLAQDVRTLTFGLGLCASIREKVIDGVSYYEVGLMGDCSVVPTRLQRKQATPRRQIKSVRHSGFVAERLPGLHRYYGVVLGGDRRYLMADGTVTHNTATFQVPALVREGGTLVFSPLIALMKDQCDDAEKRGIPATYINSHVDETEAQERLEDFISGKYKLLYVAPERIRSRTFWRYITQADIAFIVVDEAHCCSRWGHDFRPMYARIHEVVEAFQTAKFRAPVIAVTATATARVEKDIVKSLGMREDYARIIGDPIRANLNYIIRRGNKFYHLDDIMDGWNTRTGRYILYSSTRNFAHTVAELLQRRFGESAVGIYHAGMNRKDRTSMQDRFKNGDTPVIVATNAFGMGIDVPNIRAVVHLGPPGTLEDYMQEAGRAGRDGLPSDVIILVEPKDIDIQEYFINMSNPPARLYRAVWSFLLATCPAGDALQYTAKKFMEEMQETGYLSERSSEAQINTVLNVLEKNKLIRRTDAKPGKAFQITPSRFFAGEGRMTSDKERAVFDTLATMVRAQLEETGNPDQEIVRLTTTSEKIAKDSGVSDYATAKALKIMRDADMVEVEKQYTGKVTEVLKRPKTLDGTLDFAALEHKREAAHRRLEIMVEYTELGEHERKDYVRNYFLNTCFSDERL